MSSIPIMPIVSIPKFVNAYIVSDSQYSKIVDALGSVDPATGLQSLLVGTTPYDGIARVLQVPAEFSVTGTDNFEFVSGVWSVYDGSGSALCKKVGYRYHTSNTLQIDIPKIHNNYLDYEPYTQVMIYLPFVGYQKLPTNVVMGGTITINYSVDVCTGRGICHVHCLNLETNYDNNILAFECDFSNDIPMVLSNASLFNGALQLAGNVVGASGLLGEVMPSTTATIGNITRSGAMADMRAFVEIITKPEPSDDSGRSNLMGLPANKIVALKSVTGYIRVEEIHTDGINATEAEKAEIERLLKSGVTVSSWS